MQQHVGKGAPCGTAGGPLSQIRGAKADTGFYYVTGILVHAASALEYEVRSAIEALPGALVHAHVEGKIVVTLEGPVSSEVVDALNAIQRMPGVLCAVLISEHSEPIETIREEIPHDR